MKLHPYLIPITKTNLKWIEDLNIRPDIVKQLDENLEKKLLNIGLSNDFLDMMPKAQTTKQKLTSGTTPILKASAQQKKQSAKSRDNLQSRREYLQTINWKS